MCEDTTAEIPVRFVVLLLVAFVALAERLGLETILGAFLAGALVGLVDRDSATPPRFLAKLEAIGYGFLVPVFFVSSWVQLDLRGLLAEPAALLQVPVFLVALLVVRGLPALLHRRSVGRGGALAAGLLRATSLPFSSPPRRSAPQPAGSRRPPSRRWSSPDCCRSWCSPRPRSAYWAVNPSRRSPGHVRPRPARPAPWRPARSGEAQRDPDGPEAPMTPSGQLVAVSVGRPRTVPWRGRQVETAIWKAPVAGPRWVRRLNVDGDAQADLVGHGGEHRAVFVYQRESYAYWERHLGRQLPDPGTFGENLTVEGLADDEVCVGDRLAIGGALFEVTQPRVTCHKVGIRLDEPRMPALLTAHGRPGFYLRVLQEGEIGAGDPVHVVRRDPARLTVRRVSQLLYTPARDEATLRAALGVPALSEGWKESFRQLLAAGDRPGNPGLAPQAADGPAYPGFRPFAVARVVAESAHVVSVHLVPGDGGPAPPWLPGQYVSLRLTDTDGPVVRSYSLSVPAGPELRVSVKRKGRGSGLVHGLTVGARVEVAAPRGAFGFDPHAPGPVVLVSAGIGVTPVLGCLLAQVATSPERRLVWVHVARSPAEHSFAAEADAALARMPSAVRHVRYTAADVTTSADATGRLTLGALGALGVDASHTAYVCGPDGFAADVRRMLGALGVPGAAVHVESFGTAPAAGRGPAHPPEPPAAGGPPVTFARAGVTTAFDRARWSSLLELAEACDVPVRWSCRTGVCHSCETALVDGAVTYDPAPLEAPGGELVLICCARPTTAATLDL